MTFDKLHNETNCNCIDGAQINDASLFGLKTNKDHLRQVDFDTYWEKGKRTDGTNCKEICSLKGRSLSIITEENKNDILKIFSQLFPVAPKYKPYLTIVTLGENTGVVKHTPNTTNPYHYDMYKSDSFEITKINFIQSIPLNENVSS